MPKNLVVLYSVLMTPVFQQASANAQPLLMLLLPVSRPVTSGLKMLNLRLSVFQQQQHNV
jgi:hypothetical protein